MSLENDKCKDCNYECIKMSSFSAKKAEEFGAPNPLHCLCVAILGSINRTKDEVGLLPAFLLAELTISALNKSLRHILQESNKDDAKGKEVIH